MAEAHTPGPWSVKRCDDDGYAEPAISRLRIINPDWTLAVVLQDCSALEREGDANARLLAAAPALLAALIGVVAVADRKTVEFDAARAAIALAEGRKREEG